MRNVINKGKQGRARAVGFGPLLQATILTVALLAASQATTWAAPEPTGSQTHTAWPTVKAPDHHALEDLLAASEPVTVPPRPRPRTLAAARERQDGQAGKAAADALEAYDAALVDAVQQRWHDLIDGTRILSRPGNVVLAFNLHEDGSLSGMDIANCETGPLCSALCQRAVLDPSPYAPWPVAMRRTLGADHRRVTITFCHLEDDGDRPQTTVRRQLSHLVCELRYRPRRPACLVQRQHPIYSDFAISLPWGAGWPLGDGDDSFSSSQRKRWEKDVQERVEKDLRRQADFVSLPSPFLVVPK